MCPTPEMVIVNLLIVRRIYRLQFIFGDKCENVRTQTLGGIERCSGIADVFLYGDNVFEKDGIRRDRTGDGEKTRCLCGKRGIFNRDGPAMGPQIIRQLE